MSALSEYTLASVQPVGIKSVVTLDRAPFITVGRVGRVAIGVGGAACEIREVESVSGAAITLTEGLFNAHAAGEKVFYFENSRLPASWFGIVGNSPSVDNRAKLSALLREARSLEVDGQFRDVYISGPVTIPQGVKLMNMRVIAMSGAAYVGSLDGPEHPKYITNAMMQLGQFVRKWTFGDGVFTTVNPAGVASPHNASSGSLICFDHGDDLPDGLVAGRCYRAWGADLPYTVTAADNTFTTPSPHGFVRGDTAHLVVISSGTGGATIQTTKGPTKYTIKETPSTTTFKLANSPTSPNATELDITSDGSGVINLFSTTQFRLIHAAPARGTLEPAEKPDPTASDFVPLSGTGSGWVHVGLRDNCKFYAERLTIQGNHIGRDNVGKSDSATSTIKVTHPARYRDGDPVRFRSAAPAGGKLLKTYYVINRVAGSPAQPGPPPVAAVPDSFELAETPGGPAVSFTSIAEGVQIVATTKMLNGAIWGMQQPSRLDNVRIDDCPGFGVRVQAQQSYWSNFEAIGNGWGMEIGGETPGEIGEFIWLFGFDVEQSQEGSVLVRSAKNVHIEGAHNEDTGLVPWVECLEAPQMLTIRNAFVGTSGPWVRVAPDSPYKTDYLIENLQNHGASTESPAIEDATRGIFLRKWSDFRGRVVSFRTWSSSDSTNYLDPHPIRQDGLFGRSHFAGGTQPRVPSTGWTSGFGQTGDLAQFRRWDAASLNVLLDPASGVFTAYTSGSHTTQLAHGIAENEEIGVYTGSVVVAAAGSPEFSSNVVYFARNVTATTFQIARQPGVSNSSTAVLKFDPSTTTDNWSFSLRPKLMLTTAATLDPANDKFTVNAHGLLDGMRLKLSNPGAIVMAPGSQFASGDLVYVVSDETNTFQVARDVAGAALAFDAGTATTGWTVALYDAPVHRITAQGHPIMRRTTSPAPSELRPGEFTLWLDLASQVPTLRWKGKDTAGTVYGGSVPGVTPAP